MSVSLVLRNFNGVSNFVRFDCDNTFAEITTPGFLNLPNIAGDMRRTNSGKFQWGESDLVLITYNLGIGLFSHNPSTSSFFTSLTQSSELLSYTPSVTFANPGNLSVSYSVRQGTYFKMGPLTYVHIALVFTPTYTTSTGALKISLPTIPVIQFSGNMQIFDTSNVVFPVGTTFPMVTNVSSESNISIQASGSGAASNPMGVSSFPTGILQTMVIDIAYT